MEPSQDFKSLQASVQKSLISTVKTANRLAAEDLTFQRTVNPDVGQNLEDKSSRILKLSNRLLQSAAKACGVKSTPKLEDAEDIDMKWRGVVDVVDSVLEKADTALDEYTGLVKRKEPPTPDPSTKSKRPKSTNKVVKHANISKPQLQFDQKPSNFPTTPWKPLITSKPNAILPLEESLVTFTAENGSQQFEHPYETEIKDMTYPQTLYQAAEPIMYQPVETTKATYVDSYEGVLEMLEELKKAKEIAVDLEHHDFRTYVGLVSLMQISTRDKDWIVDTLRPWRQKLEVLNEVFTDPKIVKVFHGAYMDMIWLQRDLGLYVNGLFDTFFACDQLYSGRSLAFLLSKFVDFDADKQYQLADWRMRPIPEEMMYYARSDTHYLLYIFDRVRNDLLAASQAPDAEKNYMDQVLKRSRELSLSRHEHPGYNEESGEGSRGWYSYVFKHSHLAFDKEQFAVFKALWKWRDVTARKEDESTNFVLSTGSIAEIARINPPDAKALHSLLPVTASLARPRFNEIWEQIRDAKNQGGPSLLNFFTSMAPDALLRKRGVPIAARETPKLIDLNGEVTVTRLTKSQLFGDMPISTRWEKSRHIPQDQNDRIPFPWQKFVEQATDAGELHYDESPGDAAGQEQSMDVEAPAGNAEPQEEVDQEFTLKRGQKRKSEVIEDPEEEDEEEEEEASSANEQQDVDEEMQDANGVISVVDEPEHKSKKQRKKDRKAQQKDAQAEQYEKADARQKLLEEKAARKAAKKEKKLREKEEKEKKYDAVPFDYSQASSVLHAPKAPMQEGKRRVFDPYSKTGENEIKGGRRAPPIKGERSATFRK